MKVVTEKEAERFLSKEGFSIAEGFFVKRKSELNNKKFENKFVAKASGKNIVHKKDLGGIALDIDSLEKAEKSFDKIKKIKGVEEVFFQRQLKSKEFLLGIKKTPEFGHTLVFGVGGSGVESKKDFAFRVCPGEIENIFGTLDAMEMVEETGVGREANLEDRNILVKEIMKLCKLAEKFPKIKELDINPLMFGVGNLENEASIKEKKVYVVDARIVFE